MITTNSIFESIVRPTLLTDTAKTKKNIKFMYDKVKKSNKIFRPHFKTHQSKAVGRWFKELGVNKITVSSVDMASYFSEHFSDITIAIPVNIRQIDEISRIATETKLNLLLENLYSAEVLDKKLSKTHDIYIEIDVDYGRTGIYWKNMGEIIKLAKFIDQSDKMQLVGILTHAGQTYHAKNVIEIKKIYTETARKMQQVKKELQKSGFDNIIVSVGDTPGSTVIDNFDGVDELRPGNFVFYDLTQSSLDVCKEDQISIAVACPVISKYPERNEIVVYGGAIHLSKEYYEIEYNNTKVKCFGKVALPILNGWSSPLEGVFIKSISQEHGVIRFSDRKLLDTIEIGDILLIIPVHSCLTANLYSSYLTLEGNNLDSL
ncbi:MAG: alanine racemase [Candidatus Hodarchaeales archaeon]